MQYEFVNFRLVQSLLLLIISDRQNIMEELFEHEGLLSGKTSQPSSSIGEPWEDIHFNMQKAIHGSSTKFRNIQTHHIEDAKDNNNFKKNGGSNFPNNIFIKKNIETQNLLKQKNTKPYLRIDTETRKKLKSEMRNLVSNDYSHKNLAQNGIDIKDKQRRPQIAEALRENNTIVNKASIFSKQQHIVNSSNNIWEIAAYKSQKAKQSSQFKFSNQYKNQTQIVGIQAFPNICESINKTYKSKTQSISSNLGEGRIKKNVLTVKKDLAKVNIMLDKSHSVYELHHYGHLLGINERCRPIHSIFVDSNKQTKNQMNNRNMFTRGRGKLNSLHSSISKEHDSKRSRSKQILKEKLNERSRPIPVKKKLKLNRNSDRKNDKQRLLKYPLRQNGSS